MHVAEWVTPAQFFPWPYVQKGLDRIDAVVYRHSITFAQSLHLERARSCPGCRRGAAELFWVGISDPEEAWDAGTGRVGFLTLCENCRLQVDFLIDAELTDLQAEDWRAGHFFHFG